MQLSGIYSGNLEGTGKGLSPIAGAEKSGLDNARSRSNQPEPQPYGPTYAQTPEEALTYIDLLHKAGRMEDLAAILRQSKVFREAWLILQRSFMAPSKISEDKGPANLEGASEPEHNSTSETLPKSVNSLNPAGRLIYPQIKAFQVYQSQQGCYEQERNSRSRLSLRV